MSSRESAIVRVFSPLVAALAGILAPLIVTDVASGEAFKPFTTILDTNLRKAPRTDTEILAVIPNGTTVLVGACYDGWCGVSWNGWAGYAIGHNLGLAAPQRTRDMPIVAWPGDHGSSQQSDWSARAHEGSKERKEQEDEGSGSEHSFVLEFGTAGEWPLRAELPNFGGTIAGEIEPIENWLEIEFGVATLATSGYAELSEDLLFKKPFRLSPTVEFMAGAGPSYSQPLNGPERGGNWSAEFALDWMFWPSKNLGWFIEPTWSVNPRNGQQSAAVSIGVLIGFPK
jgi:Bacterial SH3 domain